MKLRSWNFLCDILLPIGASPPDLNWFWKPSIFDPPQDCHAQNRNWLSLTVRSKWAVPNFLRNLKVPKHSYMGMWKGVGALFWNSDPSTRQNLTSTSYRQLLSVSMASIGRLSQLGPFRVALGYRSLVALRSGRRHHCSHLGQGYARRQTFRC